jgi:hypothetical protein
VRAAPQVYTAQLAVAAFALRAAAAATLPLAAPAPPLLLAAVAAGWSAHALLKVDLGAAGASAQERAYGWRCAAAALALLAALFALEPPALFGWDAARASAALGGAVEDVLRRSRVLAGGPTPPGQRDAALAAAAAALTPPPAAVRAALAAAGAALAALLFAPALRFTRAYWLHQQPPEWAGDVFRAAPRRASGARLTLHLLLPLAAALTWVKPLFQEPLGLSPRGAAAAQAAAALAAGAVMLSNARLLAQLHLASTLPAWYALRHGAGGGERARAQALVGAAVRAHAEAVLSLLGKAAVQVVAPGALFLSLGLALAGAAAAGPEGAGPAVTSCAAGFLAWWAGTVWFAYCGVALWLFRTGMLRH